MLVLKTNESAMAPRVRIPYSPRSAPVFVEIPGLFIAITGFRKAPTAPSCSEGLRWASRAPRGFGARRALRLLMSSPTVPDRTQVSGGLPRPNAGVKTRCDKTGKFCVRSVGVMLESSVFGWGDFRTPARRVCSVGGATPLGDRDLDIHFPGLTSPDSRCNDRASEPHHHHRGAND